MALLAQTPYVAIFDDDTIPGKRWFENCLNTMKTHEGILGTLGIILKSNKYQGCGRAGWNGAKGTKPIEVDLVGHAWFMKRKWLQYLWYEEPISWENGEDIQLSYLAQKYGGVKTFVPPHPLEKRELWGSTQGMKLGADKQANYLKHRTKHIQERNRCVTQAIKRG